MIDQEFRKFRRLMVIALCLFITNFSTMQMANAKQFVKQETSNAIKHRVIKKDGEVFVRIAKKDLEKIERQAFLSRALLQRIRDLEKLYKQLKSIVEGINKVVKVASKILNINEDTIEDFLGGIGLGNDNDSYEHISGVVMTPGFVTFSAKVTEPGLTFDDLGLTNMEMDIYYNRAQFVIDHIEGDGVFGDEFKNISLPQRTSAAKQRIKLPLSDVLASEVRFRVYLAPLDPDTIVVGDKTRMDIRYYKRVAKNEFGERIPPLTYAFTESSAREIEVSVK